MRGYSWGVSSVVLATLAQLLMKWGMMQLPLFSFSMPYLWLVLQQPLALFAVLCGLVGYILSMICWFFVLRHLPLNRAYPLLSLSYVLVYLATLLLPGFNEPATLLKTIAIASILLGIWLVNSKPKSKVS